MAPGIGAAANGNGLSLMSPNGAFPEMRPMTAPD